jgi:disulfide bond formation protein DsbB
MIAEPRRLLGAMAALAAAALLLALLLQHGWDMRPCAWCVLQRLVCLAIILVAGAGSLARVRAAWLGAGLIGVALSAAGLAAALHQHFVAARSDACGVSFAEKIIMAAGLHEIAPWLLMPDASCQEANLPWLGVPFALWGAALFTLCGAAAVGVTVTAWRGRRAAGGGRV